MEGQAETDEARPNWPAWALGGGIVAAFCGLVLWGLAWGVPSRERSRLEGASPEARTVPQELVERSWDVWGSRGRRAEVADAFPRHLFNPLRSYHPDEYQVFKSLGNMRPGRLDFDPRNYIYPSLHTYITGGALGACSLLGIVRLEKGLGYYLDHPDDLGRLYVVGRALSLLAAVGTLLLVWRLGEGMGRWTGLLALALLAAMPAFGLHGHNLTRDTFTALAVLAFFACCRRLERTGSAKWYDLAGGAAGLCVGFQYFAVAMWVLVPVAALLWVRREGESKRALAGGLAASVVLMVAIFAVTSPYHLLRADKFLADFQSETVHVGGGGVLARLASLGWATHLPRMLPALVTWPVTVLVALGVAWALARREADDWLLLAWVLVWAAVVGFDGRSYSRYYVPLLPALALLGARALMAGWTAARRWVRPPLVREALSVVVLLAVVCPAAAMTWAWSRLYALENSRTLAGQWIAQHVPAKARIGVTDWPWQFEMPPMDPERYRLVRLGQSPEKPDYLVTSSLQSGTILGEWNWRVARGRSSVSVAVGGEWYRLIAEFRVPHPFLGTNLWRLPEDMRYVNPVIYVFERAESQAQDSVRRGAA